jgi:hypothetical protein
LSALTKPHAFEDTGAAADEREAELAPFSYHVSGDGKVFISWQGRLVMTLKGKDARHFLGKVAGLDGAQAQLVMAKITGNFKRGNER